MEVNNSNERIVVKLPKGSICPVVELEAIATKKGLVHIAIYLNKHNEFRRLENPVLYRIKCKKNAIKLSFQT